MTTAEPGSSATTTELAPAKVNLTLHVTGQRPDGYHLLDTLVAFADAGDRLSIRRASGLHLSVTGPFAAGVPSDESNLVLRAAKAVGLSGAEIDLEKHLPAAAGIGGGSSDAAALLRAATRSHGLSVPDPALILALGADVPMCLNPVAQHVSGIGDLRVPVSDMPPLPVVLVNPGVAVSTAQVFGALRERSGSPMTPRPAGADQRGLCDWLVRQRNDLESPATEIAPVIGKVLDELRVAGATLSRMSGSGATCFGLFETMDDACRAEADLRRTCPGYWVRATLLT